MRDGQHLGKVKQNEDKVFRTVRGLEFTYQVDGEKIIHTRSKVTLSRSDFEKAVSLKPQKPSDLHDAVTGPSYVYAITSDTRMK